jgi:hypothetical protein
MLYTPPPNARAAWRRPRARPLRAGRPVHAQRASPLQRARTALVRSRSWPRRTSVPGCSLSPARMSTSAPCCACQRRRASSGTAPSAHARHHRGAAATAAAEGTGRGCPMKNKSDARLGGKHADARALRRAGRPVQRVGGQHAAGRQRGNAVAQECGRLAPKQALSVIWPCAAATTDPPQNAARRRPRLKRRRAVAQECDRLAPKQALWSFGRALPRRWPRHTMLLGGGRACSAAGISPRPSNASRNTATRRPSAGRDAAAGAPPAAAAGGGAAAAYGAARAAEQPPPPPAAHGDAAERGPADASPGPCAPGRQLSSAAWGAAPL